MTQFCFEHVFRAPSPDAVFAAYFDSAHQIEQDRRVEIIEREVMELTDRGDELHRVCRVVPKRQLPVLVKPFISGSLHYIESVTWRRRKDEISIDIRPSMLKGRVQILGSYRLDRVGSQAIRRRYAGDVSVDIALLAARIERGIILEFEKSMPITSACTQDWLDRQTNGPGQRSVAARA